MTGTMQNDDNDSQKIENMQINKSKYDQEPSNRNPINGFRASNHFLQLKLLPNNPANDWNTQRG